MLFIRYIRICVPFFPDVFAAHQVLKSIERVNNGNDSSLRGVVDIFHGAVSREGTGDPVHTLTYRGADPKLRCHAVPPPPPSPPYNKCFFHKGLFNLDISPWHKQRIFARTYSFRRMPREVLTRSRNGVSRSHHTLVSKSNLIISLTV